MNLQTIMYAHFFIYLVHNFTQICVQVGFPLVGSRLDVLWMLEFNHCEVTGCLVIIAASSCPVTYVTPQSIWLCFHSIEYVHLYLFSDLNLISLPEGSVAYDLTFHVYVLLKK